MNKKEVGLMIRNILIEEAFSVRYFSVKTGIDVIQLYRIFNGEDYTIDHFIKVLDELDLSISITKKEK